jgi:TetR/AcrR family transcriptional regulator, lmrAB and yxaGH operons repressor
VPRPSGDSRERLISATQKRLQTHGYFGTSIKDIAVTAGSPIGSLYFLFPGGKDEIVIAALERSGLGVLNGLEFFLAAAKTPRAVVISYVQLVRDVLANSGYIDGCPLATVALEVAPRNPEISLVIAEAFQSWVQALAIALVNVGMTKRSAQTIATLSHSAVEGALVVARTQTDTDVFDEIVKGLVAATVQLGKTTKVLR